ncbi:MAG TPA: hypothetical protein VME23_22270 [Terracidiphilus sp.]|nr:hypothetical protein [Terracidiphilus sp.]
MIKTCHYVMPSGLRCQAPAMRGCAFCYHHSRSAAPSRKSIPAESRIELPARLDSDGITQTLHQVLNALGSCRISPRRASILLYGLQMALDNPQESDPESTQADRDRFTAELDKLLLQMGP